MKLFLDYDGVVNFEATRSSYLKNKDVYGWLRRADYNSRTGWERVNYSAELIAKLNNLKGDHNFTWLWLTTWVDEAMSIVNGHAGAHGDGYVDWDPYTGITDKTLHLRNDRKYAAIKANYNGEPFIWVDDEATIKFNPNDFDVPTLIITPDPKYGLVPAHLKTMKDFLVANS